MPLQDRQRLAARTQAEYSGRGYRNLFVPDLNAVAAVGNDVAAQFTAAETAAAAAAASLAAAQQLTGASYGAGEEALQFPRNAELGTAAFMDAVALAGLFPVARGAAYQITPADFSRVLIAETGTLTWTLPRLADLFPGWWVRVWNRAGANLTIQRTAPDVIGASATSITIADGTGVTLVYRDTARFERIA